MKRSILYYLAGILTGIVLMMLFAGQPAKSNQEEGNSPAEQKETEGLTLFDEPAEALETSRFEVFQVLDKGLALARCENSFHLTPPLFDGPTVLLVDDEKYYYDGQVVSVPQGSEAQHVGIYHYATSFKKMTIPVVRIAPRPTM